MQNTKKQQVHQQVQQWLEQVVIGLNLCPFAAKPNRNQQIQIFISEAQSEDILLEEIYQQLKQLDRTPVDELETTLVVTPGLFDDFADYNQYLDLIDALVFQMGYQGIYQVASFHPDYCFHGTEPEDAENLTNRSPYPIFHLIREESMEKVLKHYPDPEGIPERNIERVEGLSPEEIEKLFPFLK
ncbi:DUF1415 domain-containing protein [Photobacterium gaetbulicola]|uniref:Uncharacterized protein n=1 Tax=Photobacterium gaetbulicola Gung47 TaxID=658445 RepID=A0A0C5WE87_9GAMM|nr:DUF1415 domain-containing protein [Photobacterium gaetbulicola]AJR05398.1 hypothetical protein H744_1c0373 [Photobacterium gaetbulicola Gung47]PSU12721.1 DUF1415 domain-containing protein [Photobacterium gaetbulicola]